MIASNVSLSCARCPGGGVVATAAATADAYEESSGSVPPSLSPTGHLVVAVCLGFIGTSGFVSNFLVLTLFCRYRALRTPMNLLLVSISASDLLVSVLGTPFSFAASTQGRWLIGRTGCVWYGFVNACLGERLFSFGLSRDTGHGASGVCIYLMFKRTLSAPLSLTRLQDISLWTLCCAFNQLRAVKAAGFIRFA